MVFASSQSTGFAGTVGSAGASPSAAGGGGSKYPTMGANETPISSGGFASSLPCAVGLDGTNVTVMVLAHPACRCPTRGENAKHSVGVPSVGAGHSNRKCFSDTFDMVNATERSTPRGPSSKRIASSTSPARSSKTTSAAYPSPTNAIVCAPNAFRFTANRAECA